MTYVRRGPDACEQPADGRPGDVWRCGMCGRLWAYDDGWKPAPWWVRARWFNNDGEWLRPPNPNHEETP